MRVRKANVGEIFRCSAGHYYPEALLVEGQDPAHLNGTYCLVCFGARVIGRLAVPRATAVDDPFEPVAPESSTEIDPTQTVVSGGAGYPRQEEVPLDQAEEVPDPHKEQAEQPTAKPAARKRPRRRQAAKRR